MLSGTSTSAPVVAGVAALLIGEDPSLSPDDVKVRLMGSADPLAGATRLQQGAGLLDVAGALASNARSHGYALSDDLGDGTTILTEDDYVDWDKFAWTKFGWTKFRWTKFRWTKFRWTKFRWTASRGPSSGGPSSGGRTWPGPSSGGPSSGGRSTSGRSSGGPSSSKGSERGLAEIVGHDETAVRKRTVVSVYVALVCAVAAAVSVAAGVRDRRHFTLDLVAFIILATLTDLREIRLPGSATSPCRSSPSSRP